VQEEGQRIKVLSLTLLMKIYIYLLIALQSHVGEGKHGGKNDSPTLDRIDPNKGYVKGNIQVLSHLANMMKSNATAEELHLFADWIKENI